MIDLLNKKNIRPCSLFFAVLLFIGCSNLIETHSKESPLIFGLLMDQNGNPPNVPPGDQPSLAISSFSSTSSIILVSGSNTQQAGLNVETSGNYQLPLSYSYEIESDTSGGILEGSDTASGKQYTAGASSGDVRIKVTVESSE